FRRPVLLERLSGRRRGACGAAEVSGRRQTEVSWNRTARRFRTTLWRDWPGDRLDRDESRTAGDVERSQVALLACVCKRGRHVADDCRARNGDTGPGID